MVHIPIQTDHQLLFLVMYIAYMVMLIIMLAQAVLMVQEDMLLEALQEPNMVYMVLQRVAEPDTQDISLAMYIVVVDHTCHQMSA